MKLAIAIMCLMFCNSCGRNHTEIRVERNNYMNQKFEGVYNLDYNGYLELIVNQNNNITITREGQLIQSINPISETICVHPVVYAAGLKAFGDKFYMTIDLNYSVANGIRTDSGDTLISGARRTDYQFSKKGSNEIEVSIKIYSNKISSDGNVVVVDRKISGISFDL